MWELLYRAAKQAHARLVVVSKFQSIAKIAAIYEQGQRVFAENRVQDLMERYKALPTDIEWHLIGHLQTNKVKTIAPFIAMIQSVDSLHLLEEINRQAAKCDRIIDCLFQFHVAQEDSKFGLKPGEEVALLNSPTFKNMENVRICGIMGMATFTDDTAQIRREFQLLHSIFTRIKQDFFPTDPHFKEISMGMSSDWQIALEEGSTLLRVGSLVFN